MEALKAFKFTRKNSVVDKLDPRTRFFVTLLLAALSLLTLEVKRQLLLLVLVFIISIIAKRFSLLIKGLKGVVPIAVLIFLLNWITELSQGFATPLAMTLRFLVLTSSFSLFFLTTPPDDLALALEQMHVPRDYSLLVTMSFRFVPTLAQDVQLVLDALRSRGLEVEKGKLRDRVKNYVYLMVPLVVFEVRRSLMIAEALEARGFGARVKPSRMVTLKFAKRDAIALALILGFTAIFLSMK
ncbi:MAG: energy-coupling factor transporter transmembrane component T family protein [Infirmifilum sp.]|uniref:Energy-coupling factor transporter transmembrane protein EcfT n=1 Tax=Infirmifilum uzonense TaxID=1550241 RepID=A0A0F7FJ18_9CREN|nr:energy-coupling factor transporter transmembrane component T [Infirmifilum uzonense]AKG38965.1 hypothetical protein MA03_06470 [Infirmifilum uzonense]